jgi:5-methylcytosine-specific restriction endonuclease McrA
VNNYPFQLRTCLLEPIPEIFEAARHLEAAVSARLEGKRAQADELIRLADVRAITEWTESLWGAGGPRSRALRVEKTSPFVPKDQRTKLRMPTKEEARALLTRDGFQCRFCGIPVVRAEVRFKIRRTYPEALRWGTRNSDQHSGFQAMWLQYDHLLPHARGGSNELSNMLVTCAPCNNGRSNLTLEEVGLADPRLRDQIRSRWDGLERFCLQTHRPQ